MPLQCRYCNMQLTTDCPTLVLIIDGDSLQEDKANIAALFQPLGTTHDEM